MLRVKWKMCNATVNICNRRRKVFRNIILLLLWFYRQNVGTKRRSERYIEKRLIRFIAFYNTKYVYGYKYKI